MSNQLAVRAAVVHVGGVAQRHDTLSLDRVLFAAATSEVARETGGPLRVDARPLTPNPSLVTLRHISAMPGAQDPAAPAAGVFARADSAVLAARHAVLSGAGIELTDAIEDARCPGASLPEDPDVDALRLAKCPLSGPYRSMLVALPREGGPYWPCNIDERLDFARRKVYSVRVLLRMMDRAGSVESSRDLVFERNADGAWRLIRMRSLLIVE